MYFFSGGTASTVIPNRADFKPIRKWENEDGVKMFGCPYCEFESKHWPNTSRHIDQQHEGMKWFKCPVPNCGAAFLYKEANIARHKSTHPDFPEMPNRSTSQYLVKDSAEIDRLRAEQFVTDADRSAAVKMEVDNSRYVENS